MFNDIWHRNFGGLRFGCKKSHMYMALLTTKPRIVFEVHYMSFRRCLMMYGTGILVV